MRGLSRTSHSRRHLKVKTEGDEGEDGRVMKMAEHDEGEEEDDWGNDGAAEAITHTFQQVLLPARQVQGQEGILRLPVFP